MGLKVLQMKPWFSKICQTDVGRNVLPWQCGINITFQSTSPLSFWQHWGTGLSTETWTRSASQQHLVNHQSSHVILAGLEQGGGDGGKKKSTRISRVQTETHQCHFSTHFILCVWRQLSIKSCACSLVKREPGRVAFPCFQQWHNSQTTKS